MKKGPSTLTFEELSGIAFERLKEYGDPMNRVLKVVNSTLGPLFQPEQSDFARAIVGGSAVELILEEAMILKMDALSPHPDQRKKEIESLFKSPVAPLGSFAAKIHLAWAFGIYDSRTRLVLDYIRDVRNSFAHSRIGTITFSHTDIEKMADKIRPLYSNPSRIEGSTIFAISCLGMAAVLTFFAEGKKKINFLPVSASPNKDQPTDHQDR